MARMGLYSYRLTEPTNEFFGSFASYYFLFNNGIFTLIASACFVYKHWPQMDIVSQPLTITLGGLTCFTMILSVGCKLNTVKLLHLKLQGMVDEGEFFLISFNFIITIKVLCKILRFPFRKIENIKIFFSL